MSLRSLTIGATVSGLLTLAIVSAFFSFSWVVIALSFPVGARYNDEDVADWTPLLPVSNEDRVRCPWCDKPGRKLTARGAIRRHGKPVWPPQDCEGSGRRPSEFEGGAA